LNDKSDMRYNCKSFSRVLPVLFLTFLIDFSLFLNAPAESYKIGPEDVLHVSIYNHPDLSNTLRVASDGVISFPLLGRINAAGYTVTEFERALEKQLGADFLVNPQVTVFIKEYKSRKIYILGEVKHPGIQELRGQTSLLEVISRAGGVKETSGKIAVISPPTSDKSVEFEPKKINLARLLDEGDTSLNIAVDEGFVILIPKANSFFVFGEVRSPGAFRLDKKTTVLQAITLAGGFTKIASPSRTKIIRVKEGKEKTIYVDISDITKRSNKSADIYLEPDDMIIIPESFF